jgi:drug/metabolite transporter (DMT)-like permease
VSLFRHPSSDQAAAALAAFASSGLVAAMAMVARLLSRKLSGPQIAMVRFAVGMAVVLLLAASLRIRLRPQRWGWLIARGAFGGTAALLYFISIERIGVGMATLLNYTSPVWSLLFAWLLLRERPRRTAFVALAMTLAGVVLLTSGPSQGWHLGKWELVATLSAVLAGMAITSTRATRMEREDGSPRDSSWTVFTSFTTLGFVATAPAVLPPFGVWVAPSPLEWLLLLVCGLLSVGGQLLMISALGRLTAVGMGIIQQTTVVLAMAGGLVLFGERLSARGTVGSLITMAGVVWSVLSDRRPSAADG